MVYILARSVMISHSLHNLITYAVVIVTTTGIIIATQIHTRKRFS